MFCFSIKISLKSTEKMTQETREREKWSAMVSSASILIFNLEMLIITGASCHSMLCLGLRKHTIYFIVVSQAQRFCNHCKKTQQPWLWCHLEVVGGITTLSALKPGSAFILQDAFPVESLKSHFKIVSLPTSCFDQISRHFLFVLFKISAFLYIR